MTAVKKPVAHRGAKPQRKKRLFILDPLLISRINETILQSRKAGRSMAIKVGISPTGRVTYRAPDPREEVAREDVSPAAELEAARARGRALANDILTQNDMVSAEEFAKFLRTSRATVNAKRQRHEILGLEGFKRGYRFPIWQVGKDGKPFSALPALFEDLGGPWAVYRFLVQPHAELDGLTAREALNRGRDKLVLDVARAIASGTFS